MTTIDQLITHLAHAVYPDTAAADAVGLRVTDVDLVVPIESTGGEDDAVLIGIPRGLLKTGFERPLGELRLRFGGVEL
jgi:hypothetical protein